MYLHVQCWEPKKGNKITPIWKKTTWLCPSRSYYSTFKGIQGVQAMVDERMEEVIRTEEPQVRTRSDLSAVCNKDNFFSVPDLSARI